MGFLIGVVVLAVAGIALAWWWVGRARAVERNARSAAGRAEIEARIQQQYRSSGGNPPANRRP
jgi:type II secretory pathway pseudopilin PulG